MFKSVIKISDKKATPKDKRPKPKPEPEPKSKADLLREKIELKRAEHNKAASRGPRAAESCRQELIALEKELSKLV